MVLESYKSERDVFLDICRLTSKLGHCVHKILTKEYRNDCLLQICFLNFSWFMMELMRWSYLLSFYIHQSVSLFQDPYLPKYLKMKHNKVRRQIHNILKIWWTFNTQGHPVVLTTLHMWWEFSTFCCLIYEDETVNWDYFSDMCSTKLCSSDINQLNLPHGSKFY